MQRLKPALQSRSQRALERLVAAAEAVLAERGLDGATIPLIARRARVATGTVYQRFHDKDALLQEVFIRFFRASKEHNRSVLDAKHWAGLTLEEMLSRLVRATVKAYRERESLLRALLQFSDTHSNAAFRRAAEKAKEESMTFMCALILTRRSEIRHSDPERAVRFAVTLMAYTLREWILVSSSGQSLSDSDLIGELSRAMLGYFKL